MLNITEENFNREVEEASGLVVVDLYADWCVPCQMLYPILETLSGEYSMVKFCRINVDSEPELAKMFFVSSIPMVAFVKGNTFLDFFVGYTEEAEIREKIEMHM